MKFPKTEAQAVLAWMNEQMYGDQRTEWSSGNEHDRMREAADFLQGLCKEKMLKRVCNYSVFRANSRPGYDDRPVDSDQFTVFAPTSEELDAAMEALTRLQKIFPMGSSSTTALGAWMCPPSGTSLRKSGMTITRTGFDEKPSPDPVHELQRALSCSEG